MLSRKYHSARKIFFKNKYKYLQKAVFGGRELEWGDGRGGPSFSKNVVGAGGGFCFLFIRGGLWSSFMNSLVYRDS